MTNPVQPIKSKALIKKFWKALKVRSDREALLFLTGINTGFRISDLLSLQVKHVQDHKGVINERIFIKEQKTRRHVNRVITPELAKHLKGYIEDYMLEYEDYLFFKQLNTQKPITRQHAWYQLKKIAHVVGIDNFGTHSLRKTFGYFAYKRSKNLALVMNLLNHKRPEVTLRYIGVDQEQQDKFMMEEWNLLDE